mmetsp:Transcript_34531/g.97839  ORF Transcript_34531/g.97839 Transcript_34531/m.97839 type:complete len:128 (+) Transcript_34531:626-1009(+)
MGRLFLEELLGHFYSCRCCGSHLADTSELISKQFHSRHGKAYLFNTVVNVCGGEREERLMTTGLHIVRDIHCTGCLQLVGWKYDEAFEKSQKYKEGKFILEREKIVERESHLGDCFSLLHDEMSMEM